MSHPLIVEVLETEFIPLFICNNNRTPGNKDRAILKKYKEPAWNYQVMRFFDESGKDIIPRADGKKLSGIGGTANQICLALKAARKKVPSYIQGVALAYRGKQLKTVDFATGSFRTGEIKLGAIDGVVRTEAGWIDSGEVTRVWYNTSRLSLQQLMAAASRLKCGHTAYLADMEIKAIGKLKENNFKLRKSRSGAYKAAPASDQKAQIRNEACIKLALTDYQLTKINAFYTRDKKEALTYLSPRQLAKLETDVAVVRAKDADNKADSKTKPAPYPFGTITKTKRIPGQQDVKGDCRKLVQGGYMKFDLSKYPADKQITSASLRIFFEKASGNRWRWVSLIKTDPTTGDLAKVFREIELHKPVLSRIITLRKDAAGKWLTIRLNKTAIEVINARLASQSPEERWIAMSFGFE